MRKINSFLLTKQSYILTFFKVTKEAEPFSSKSRTTACVSKKRLPPSDFGSPGSKTYWKDLTEVLSPEISKEMKVIIQEVTHYLELKRYYFSLSLPFHIYSLWK